MFSYTCASRQTGQCMQGIFSLQAEYASKTRTKSHTDTCTSPWSRMFGIPQCSIRLAIHVRFQQIETFGGELAVPCCFKLVQLKEIFHAFARHWRLANSGNIFSACPFVTQGSVWVCHNCAFRLRQRCLLPTQSCTIRQNLLFEYMTSCWLSPSCGDRLVRKQSSVTFLVFENRTISECPRKIFCTLRDFSFLEPRTTWGARLLHSLMFEIVQSTMKQFKCRHQQIRAQFGCRRDQIPSARLKRARGKWRAEEDCGQELAEQNFLYTKAFLWLHCVRTSSRNAKTMLHEFCFVKYVKYRTTFQIVCWWTQQGLTALWLKAQSLTSLNPSQNPCPLLVDLEFRCSGDTGNCVQVVVTWARARQHWSQSCFESSVKRAVKIKVDGRIENEEAFLHSGVVRVHGFVDSEAAGADDAGDEVWKLADEERRDDDDHHHVHVPRRRRLLSSCVYVCQAQSFPLGFLESLDQFDVECDQEGKGNDEKEHERQTDVINESVEFGVPQGAVECHMGYEGSCWVPHFLWEGDLVVMWPPGCVEEHRCHGHENCASLCVSDWANDTGFQGLRHDDVPIQSDENYHPDGRCLWRPTKGQDESNEVLLVVIIGL